MKHATLHGGPQLTPENVGRQSDRLFASCNHFVRRTVAFVDPLLSKIQPILEIA